MIFTSINNTSFKYIYWLKIFFWPKCKIHHLSFTICHFSHLSLYSFISVLLSFKTPQFSLLLTCHPLPTKQCLPYMKKWNRNPIYQNQYPNPIIERLRGRKRETRTRGRDRSRCFRWLNSRRFTWRLSLQEVYSALANTPLGKFSKLLLSFSLSIS